MKHTIRHKDGRTVEVEMARALAIRLHCSECGGWEAHPKDCPDTLCALWPYRGKSLHAISRSEGDSPVKKRGPYSSEELSGPGVGQDPVPRDGG